MINQPRKVSSPSASVVAEAMNLISVFGRGESKPILKEMLEVQTHNEKVYADSHKAKKEAEDSIRASEKLDEEIIKKHELFKKHSSERIKELTVGFQALEKDKSYWYKEKEIQKEDLDGQIKLCERQNAHFLGLEKDLERREKEVEDKNISVERLSRGVVIRNKHLDSIVDKLKGYLKEL